MTPQPPKKILIVDDETDTLRLLRLRLEKKGYQITACENGKDALLEAQKTTPDLAILDIKLSDMTGYDILKKFKANPALKNVPVIFSTADASVALKQTVRAHEANDYVIKPYDAHQLLKKIEALLH
ncbi:MAG TPA: response regulator [Candidatus Omnitrophota bacterium]|nr:two-component system response regulator [Candidatus Omnitrophota bacterium]HRK62557.1 response regulator [Candidatus Omnitrophota bacterium]